MLTMTLTTVIKPLHALRERVSGRVILPGEPAYEEARRGWNLSIDHRPAVILVAGHAQDVVAGVAFARDEGLGIAVRSTGHGIQYPADNSLLILTSPMNRVYVDAEARTARVEAGVLWQQVLDTATPHGLAPLLGSSPHVGVIGYTLGGGIGWLARRYGLAADSVRWLDIVTADGVLRRASLSENEELFWGVRGGGGNFGVVTAMGFTLYPVAKLYGGNFLYPGDAAGEALRFFRDWVETVPNELTSSISILKFPQLPQIPEAIRGQIQVIVRAAYAGASSEGERWLQPWLQWRTPVANTFREMPFAEIATISNDPVAPVAAYGSNEMFDELSDEAIEMIATHATNRISPLITTELRHAGGAIAQVVPDANAIGNREARFYFQLGGPIFAPRTKEESAAYIRRFKADLQPYFRGSVYQNFMSGDEAFNRARDAYTPDAYRRLLALKTKYDPDNLFRFSYQLVK